MGIQDLLVTPIYLIIFFLLAYLLRPYFTDLATKKYFIPALSLKFIGAISLGLVYQFYYNGGDTFNYFNHGSRWIWEAFLDDPQIGIKLLFDNGFDRDPETFQYSQRIWYYGDERSYFVVRITAFWDLFTFHTYTATALFFAVWSFAGSWALFVAFKRLYPSKTKIIAYCILFVPSVVFWGSGILKDSVTFGALGLATYSLFNLFSHNKNRAILAIMLIASCYIIFMIKVYILLAFIAASSIWLFSKNVGAIKSEVMKLIVGPIIIVFFLGVGYILSNVLVSNDSRYALDKLAQTAAITANDIRYGWGARTGQGSGYTLGNLDGSIGSMFRLAPAAINVSLFRPYFWEVSNPLMLLAAIESFIFLLFTIYLLFRGRKHLGNLFRDPQLRFCVVFSIIFAFAVGISTSNFGTLMRYKIPMMPFYLLFLVLLYSSNSSNKQSVKS